MLKKKKHIINGLFIVFPITVLYNNFAFWNIAMEGKKMSAKKSKMKNLTEGSPAKLIIGFAIPMFLGMLFQQFYSMVDTMIVGKFLGLKPLAGVGLRDLLTLWSSASASVCVMVLPYRLHKNLARRMKVLYVVL